MPKRSPQGHGICTKTAVPGSQMSQQNGSWGIKDLCERSLTGCCPLPVPVTIEPGGEWPQRLQVKVLINNTD